MVESIIGISNWPMKFSRYICSKKHPMPGNAGGLWIHEDTTQDEETKITSCKNCNRKLVTTIRGTNRG